MEVRDGRLKLQALAMSRHSASFDDISANLMLPCSLSINVIEVIVTDPMPFKKVGKEPVPALSSS